MRKILFLILFLSLANFCSTVCFALNSSVEITETSIQMDADQFQEQEGFVAERAYLYIGLRNNGKSQVNNLTLNVSYYTSDGNLILKTVIEDPLYDTLPVGEERKYKIPLGRGFKSNGAQYPYDQHGTLHHFKVEIAATKSDGSETPNAPQTNRPIARMQPEGKTTKINPNEIDSASQPIDDLEAGQQGSAPQWVIDGRNTNRGNQLGDERWREEHTSD
jgi:hypothetical protein